MYTGSPRESSAESFAKPFAEGDDDDSQEKTRLQALYRHALLDTPPDAAFDDFTRLAALICGTPIALISLLDTDRQWFKSRVGLDVTETERSIAFCDHTIRLPMADTPFIVPDATKDARFADNPLVMGDPHIRFYAGAPITTPDGYALGTLCVIDRVPRDLTADQTEALCALSRQVVHLIELRRLAQEQQRLAEKQQQLLAQRSMAQAALRLANEILEQEIVERTEEAAERTSEVESQFSGALDSLGFALDAKDAYTDKHSTRVCCLAVEIAQAVCSGDPEFIRRVDVAARLHDIGKIGVPEAILRKPGGLTPDELALIRQHPLIGHRILLPLIKDDVVLTFVRHHHEAWDGSGYPEGLAGPAIPLGARVLAVADAFDALTSERPYRPGFAKSKALDILRAGSGRQWDPAIVDALIHHVAVDDVCE